ncbi:MAG: YggT family protein [Candidatus Promineifilaceae bacterium]
MAGTLGLFIDLFYYILLARVLLSWFPGFRNNPVARLLYDITEPVLSPLRGIIPPMSGFDLSPIILFVILGFIRRML